MIEHIRNIGEYVSRAYPEKDTIDSMVNKIPDDTLKAVLVIDVTDNSIKTFEKEFYRSVVNDALFYQKGNGAMGGGIRLDNYKDSKVKSACIFCEIPERYKEIKSIVEKYISEKGKEAFAIIKINGKTPAEIFKDKFHDKMYTTMYKKIKGKHICHLCGEKRSVFNNITYSFYTNDKQVYGNLIHKEKTGVVVCEDCLDKIIIGKEYVEQNLRTYWIDSLVMFLPHKYNDYIAKLYESTKLDGEKSGSKLLENIRLNEEDVLDEIGKSDSITDMIFHSIDPTTKVMVINYQIQDVLPSRFTLVSNLLKTHRLKLGTVLRYTACVKMPADEENSSDKEKIRVLDSIFTGKRISRSLFFKRAMDVYKYYYIKGEHKKNYCMWNINKVYSFLCECGCLKKGCDVMNVYRSYEELFGANAEYFDSNEKRAWFILGRAYNTIVYGIRKSLKDDGEGGDSGESIKTSLEKNFFFARKFDFSDFVYFSNLLEEKAFKYSISKSYFKSMMCEAKDLMAKRENKLSQDEAKYLFFWGMDSYFKSEDETSDTGENKE